MQNLKGFRKQINSRNTKTNFFFFEIVYLSIIDTLIEINYD